MRRFDGAGVVVTGAASGLGRCIAGRFADEGAMILVTDIDANALARAADEIRDSGHADVRPISLDVSDPVQVAELAERARRELTAVNVLVNNAGIVRHAPFEEITLAEWNLVLSVNLTGAFLCSQALVGALRDAGGNIVNIASQVAKRGQPYTAHYVASKAGLVGLTRALAVEAAPVVRVNAVCPGLIITPMVEAELRWRGERLGQSAEDALSQWVARIPLGRVQTADDVANMVLFLASGEASAMTGQAINVTGGMVTE